MPAYAFFDTDAWLHKKITYMPKGESTNYAMTVNSRQTINSSNETEWKQRADQ